MIKVIRLFFKRKYSILLNNKEPVDSIALQVLSKLDFQILNLEIID